MTKVICWDFDGTLVYSEGLWRKCLYKALLEADPTFQTTPDIIGSHLQKGYSWHTPEADYRDCAGEAWWVRMNQVFLSAYCALGVDPDTAQKAADRVRPLIKRPENYRLYADALSALSICREAGCFQILLSNNYPDLEDVARDLGLGQYLNGYVISGAIGYEKPRPELFAIAKALCPDAECYFMVGDSVSADIRGGRAAGFTTVLVHQAPDPAADYTFDSLIPVCGLIRG